MFYLEGHIEIMKYILPETPKVGKYIFKGLPIDITVVSII